MAFSDDHIPDIGSLTVASLHTFIKIVAAYEAQRAIVVHDSKVWSSKSARTLLEDKKLVPKKWLAVKGWRSQLTEVVCRTTSQPRKSDVTGCQFGALGACPVVPGGCPHPTGEVPFPTPFDRVQLVQLGFTHFD